MFLLIKKDEFRNPTYKLMTNIYIFGLKLKDMKRKLFFGASFVFIAWAAISCEALSDCKKCKMVTTDSSTGQVT